MNKRNYKHGLTGHPIYQTWLNMKYRCGNKTKYYNDYKGRGITICDDWNCIKKFIEDMYPEYKKGLELERINNNLGYSKENCKWATRVEQNNNRRDTNLVNNRGSSKYKGITFHKASGKWKCVNGSQYIGLFKTEKEAVSAHPELNWI